MVLTRSKMLSVHSSTSTKPLVKTDVKKSKRSFIRKDGTEVNETTTITTTTTTTSTYVDYE